MKHRSIFSMSALGLMLTLALLEFPQNAEAAYIEKFSIN